MEKQPDAEETGVRGLVKAGLGLARASLTYNAMQWIRLNWRPVVSAQQG